MKAKVLILSVLAMFATTTMVQAQEAKTAQSGRKTIFDKGGNWFIDLQAGGAILPFGEKNNSVDFKERISWMPNVAVGRWINPYFATRVHAYGWQTYGFDKCYIEPTSNNIVRYQNIQFAGQLEFMFDLVNYYGKYSEKNWFHFIPFVGVGGAYKKHSLCPKGQPLLATMGGTINDFSAAVNGGLIMKFRLGKRVDLNLEGQMMVHNLDLIGSNRTLKTLDKVAIASAGLTFKLGKVGFNEVVPMDFAIVDDLNNQINSLRAENAELSKRPVDCPEPPAYVETKQVVTHMVEDAVYFRINNAKVDLNQRIAVEKMAKYAKEYNAVVKVVGFADEKTGNDKINMNLSERRANAVRDMLINKYGVDADKVIIDFKGDNVQPFAKNAWNRVVIMTIAQ